MNSSQGVWVIVFPFVALAAFFLVFLLNAKTFSGKFHHPYDPRSYFPFELLEGNDQLLWPNRLLVGIVFLCDVFFASYLLINIQYHNWLLYLAVFYLVIVIFRDVALTTLFFLPVGYFKGHFVVFALSICLAAVSGVASISVFINYLDFARTVSIVFIILTAIMVSFILLIGVNPRLSNWAKMDSAMNEDGSVTNSRPKRFVLAYSEWLVIGLSSFLSLVSFLGFYLADLA